MMFLQTLKRIAIASCMGLGLMTAQAQVDDLPSKGRIESMITLPAKQLYNSQIIYEAKEAELKNFLLQGWRYDRRKNCLSTGRYGSDTDVKAISPSFTVPALAKGEQLYLNITEAFSLESDYDFGSVLISTDGGETWRNVHRVTGQSEKRTTQVNISSFAGKTLEVSLVVQSDGSFESEGWEVYGFDFEIGSLTSGAEYNSLARSVTNREINITSIQDDNFPEAVFVNFEYLEDGSRINDLTISDLKINMSYGINSEISDCGYKLYKSDSTRNAPVDILFILDNSGSMGNEQDSVLANIESFVEGIDKSNNPRFGLLRFGHSFASGYNTLETTNYSGQTVNFTPDVNDFKNNVLSRNLTNGSIERGYDAMSLGLTADFRTNAQKIFVLITDENATGSNLGSITIEQITADLKQNAVTVYSWIPSNTAYDNTYAAVSAATNGSRIDILSPFDALQTEIESALGGTYTLRYCPSFSEKDSIEHCVNIGLTQPDSVVDGQCYIATPNKEYITRDSLTAEKEKESVYESSILELCFDVFDNNGSHPVSGTLFARTLDTTDTTPFRSYPLTKTTVSTEISKWCATVDTAIVKDPAVEYYAIVKYADGHELKSPSVEERFFAWTQAVLPNVAPKITLNSGPSGPQCSEFDITFDVSDSTDGYKSVDVYYREKNSNSSFSPLNVYTYTGNDPMPQHGNYTFTVPLQGEGTEYYIIAEDNHGTIGTYGESKKPNVVLGSAQSFTETDKIMQINFSGVQLGCETIGVNDTVLVKYENACGGLVKANKKVFVNPNNLNIEVYGDTSSGDNSKNGFSENDRMSIYVIRDGKEYQIDDGTSKYSTNGLLNLSGISAFPEPEIEVLSTLNFNAIPYKDNTPDLADGTDFGFQSTMTSQTFWLSNTSCGTVNFQNAQIIRGVGTNPTQFRPRLNKVSGELTVYYLAQKDAYATIEILTDAYNFTFDVKGTVSTCDEEIQYSSSVIANGDTSPTVAKGTDFGVQSSPTPRTFDLVSTCSSTITGVASSNTSDFTVTYTSSTVEVTYEATADANATITVNTSEGTVYEFAVTGDAGPCSWYYEFSDNGVDITNNDLTPNVTDGTDYGTVSSVTTHTFDLVQNNCTPLLTITNVSISGTAFTTSVSGTSVDVTFNNSGTATETLTITTTDGSFVFKVKASGSGSSICSTCVEPYQWANPLPMHTGYIQFEVLVDADPTPGGTPSSAYITGTLYNLTTGGTGTPLQSSVLNNFTGSATQMIYGTSIPVLNSGHMYKIILEVQNSSPATSGNYETVFIAAP